MSAYWKIPLQLLVLVLGVIVYLFYTFNAPPLLFSSVHTERVRESASARAYAALELEFGAAFDARRQAAQTYVDARRTGEPMAAALAADRLRQEDAAVAGVRSRASTLVRDTAGDRQFSDVNYIIPTFILTQLPIGIVGLLMLVIMLSATDTIAGELNSLATATVIDFYNRRFRPSETDRHYLIVSKVATGLWGLFACAVAVWAAALGSLIEVVNRFGSFFYGSILGVFILAVGVPFATGTGAFVGLIAGMSAVAWVASFTSIAFLWHNVIGAVVVVVAGGLVSGVERAVRRWATVRGPRG